MQSEVALDLLTILIDALIEREKEKFGSDFERLVSRDALGAYVRDVCEEVARDMADNQAESLPVDNVRWISEMCLPDGLDESTKKALVNRSEQLPFLTPDQQRHSVKFWHRQFFVYFLAANATRALAKEEVPKYLRRNLLGSEFLEGFPKAFLAQGRVVAEMARDVALELLPSLNRMDRSSGNVAAITMEMLCVYPPRRDALIQHVVIDEVYLLGDVPAIKMDGVTISTLHANQGDLRAMSFRENCHIVALHMDALTRLPADFPIPVWIETASETIRNADDVRNRVRGPIPRVDSDEIEFPFDPELLERIRRYRQFWLRNDVENTEPAGRKILEHPDWSGALSWLEAKGLARIEARKASGRPSVFVHFRLP